MNKKLPEACPLLFHYSSKHIALEERKVKKEIFNEKEKYHNHYGFDWNRAS